MEGLQEKFCKDLLLKVNKIAEKRKLKLPEGTVSASKIINALKPETDWIEVSERCSVNPSHKHFGKTPEEIRAIWDKNKNLACDRGNYLDSYIDRYVKRRPLPNLNNLDDEICKLKCEKWQDFYEKLISGKIMKGCQWTHIGNEIPLHSPKLGLTSRLDELMGCYFEDKKRFLLIDWKNCDDIKRENNWQSLLGPCDFLGDCNLNTYTLQLHIYKYILHEYGFPVMDGVLVQVPASGSVKVYEENFQYSPELVEDIVAWGKKELKKK